MSRLWTWVLAVAGFAFAIAFGKWAQSLFTQSEVIHFSVNYPSAGSSAQRMSCCNLGGPWVRDRDADWNEYASGGVLTWGEEGEIAFDVGKQGWIKQLLQPNYITISSHWMRNVGTQPYIIRLDMDMCGMDTAWKTHERDWDPVTKTSTRAIEPGDGYNMDWYFRVPSELRANPVVCDGLLTVYDAETDERLTELPIRILNSAAEG